MLNCPVGTFRDTEQAESFDDCAPCTAGSYCLEGVSTPTDVCQSGYYCPTDIANPYNIGNVRLGPDLIGSYGDQQVLILNSSIIILSAWRSIFLFDEFRSLVQRGLSRT